MMTISSTDNLALPIPSAFDPPSLSNTLAYLEELVSFAATPLVRDLCDTHTNDPRFMNDLWAGSEPWSEWMLWAEQNASKGQEWRDEAVRCLACGIERDDSPPSLRSYMSTLNRLSMPRKPLPHSAAPSAKRIDLSSKRGVHNAGMKPKKTHEVERLSELIAETLNASERCCRHVVDVGAGQGYLSRTLARPPFNLHVLAVDSVAHNIAGSEKHYARLLSPSASDVVEGAVEGGSLRHATAWIECEALRKVVDDWAETEEREGDGGEACLVGLHPCGDLSFEMMFALVERESRIGSMVLVPCCYNLSSPSNFPLSTPTASVLLSSYPSPFLNRPHLMLATHSLAHWNYIPSAYWTHAALPMKKLSYRAYLAEELRHLNRPDHFSENRLGRLPNYAYASWATYRAEAMKRLGVDAPPQAEEWTAEERQRLELVDFRIKIFWTARAKLGEVLESLILLDRFLYLREKLGDGADVRLTNVFDQSTGSSRNVAIVVDRKKQ